MRRMISIVDLTTGQISVRPSDTPTFDLPRDFDRITAVAALDARSQARYSATGGKSVVRSVHSRPLSWRVRGEECLVADDGEMPTVSEPSHYTLCAIEF
jgi:hypothetical protein